VDGNNKNIGKESVFEIKGDVQISRSKRYASRSFSKWTNSKTSHGGTYTSDIATL
jgi:hypothetical protein